MASIVVLLETTRLRRMLLPRRYLLRIHMGLSPNQVLQQGNMFYVVKSIRFDPNSKYTNVYTYILERQSIQKINPMDGIFVENKNLGIQYVYTKEDIPVVPWVTFKIPPEGRIEIVDKRKISNNVFKYAVKA